MLSQTAKTVFLSPQECDRRLAEAYAREPEEMVAKVTDVIRRASDRNGTIGAGLWLMTLGRAARPAMEALDSSMPENKMDPCAHEQMAAAAKFVRQSLMATPDASEVGSEASATRKEISALVRSLAGKPGLVANQAPYAEIQRYFHDSDPYVRAGAAGVVAMLAPSFPDMANLKPALELILDDDGFSEVGISGPYDCDGRLFHWRRERRSRDSVPFEHFLRLARFQRTVGH
jgi:hypothetical protein